MTVAPLLYLPESVQPSSGWEKAPVQQKPAPKPTTNLREAPGRKTGQTSGTHIDNLTALQKAIWLCWSCRHKFNERAHRYFYEKNMRVVGRCDGCKEYRGESHLFIHESLLCDIGGRIRHGHSWTPR